MRSLIFFFFYQSSTLYQSPINENALSFNRLKYVRVVVDNLNSIG